MSATGLWNRLRLHRSGLWLVAMLVVVVLGAAACNGSGRFAGPDAANAQKKTVTILSPSNGATNVPTSAEISLDNDVSVTNMSLTGADGQPVTGTFSTAYARKTGTWIPDAQLAYNTTYTVSVQAKDGSKTRSGTSTFTTMSEPGSLFGAEPNIGTTVGEGVEVGVGLPIRVEFVDSVPQDRWADVERRLFVNSSPPTEGSWYWQDESHVWWRPMEYWKPGTQVNVRLGIGGMDLGNGNYGYRDRLFNFSVGSAVVSTIDNGTKQMTVTQDGAVLRTIPVSLGRPETPSSSGIHSVILKNESEIFDSATFGLVGDGAYRTRVYWTVRLTWGGEYIHAADWSVGDQGVRNVSHGCVNVSPDNAQWFYELTKPGDIIQTIGTETQVDPFNGWGVFNIPWDQWKQGSALS